MIIPEQIIILAAFFVLTIIYVFNSKLKYYKFEILIKNKIIHTLKIEKEINDFQYNELQENINRRKEEEKYLKLKNQRELGRNKVSDEEIKYMVNNSKKYYQIDKCHINALNTFIELGEQDNIIMIGRASYIDLDGKEQIVTNHLWNEHRYGNIDTKKQLIDSINYKNNEKKKYFNHIGLPLNLFDYMEHKKIEVQQFIDEKKFDKLTTYSNDDKGSVYNSINLNNR